MHFLNEADALIILSSVNSIGCSQLGVKASKHVAREIKEADDLNIPMYPVDIDGVMSRNSYDVAVRYFIGKAQYINGELDKTEAGFNHVLAPLLAKLSDNKEADPVNEWQSKLLSHLENARYPEASKMAIHVDLETYPVFCGVLILSAKLSAYPQLIRLPLVEVSAVEQQLRALLERSECSEVEQGLIYYMLGVLCKEYYQPNVIQCPAGSSEMLKKRAAQLPRMPLKYKKLVRGVSRDFRKFESFWFHG